MPVVAKEQGDHAVISPEDAATRSIRQLHIGVVNIMPDPALIKTENNFFDLMRMGSNSLQIVPHYIALEGVERGKDAQQYIDKNYITLDRAMEDGMDALIITGANVTDPNLRNVPFYDDLAKAITWAESNNGPTSTLNSCFATLAYMHVKHGITAPRFDKKLWGIFKHRVHDEFNPLTFGMDDAINIPHSRWDGITEKQFIEHGMRILIGSASEAAGVHAAVSPDGLRIICLQGHPEYATEALFGEWQRDIGFSIEERLNLIKDSRLPGNLGISAQEIFETLRKQGIDLPPFPEDYFEGESHRLAEHFNEMVTNGHLIGRLPAKMHEGIIKNIDNKWRSSGSTFMSNWIAAVLDKAHKKRGRPFMDGVNRSDVFGLNAAEKQKNEAEPA